MVLFNLGTMVALVQDQERGLQRRIWRASILTSNIKSQPESLPKAPYITENCTIGNIPQESLRGLEKMSRSGEFNEFRVMVFDQTLHYSVVCLCLSLMGNLDVFINFTSSQQTKDLDSLLLALTITMTTAYSAMITFAPGPAMVSKPYSCVYIDAG